jgi:HEAT repeat protein
MDVATEYLRLAGPEGLKVFTALLAEEPHRKIRMRMCEVLARVGAPAIPSLLAQLDDKRWFVVRNAIYTLRKIGHASAVPAIMAMLEHSHARVRLEAVRVTCRLGGAAAGALLGRIHDQDPAVQLAAISGVGTRGNDGAVPELRKVLLGSSARSEGASEVQLETIRALAAISTPAALAVLEATASRRTWFWRRADSRIRHRAAQMLGGRKPRGRVSPEAVNDK